MAASAAQARGAPTDGGLIKVLIVDGQNNHAWATTTPLLKAMLERVGIFKVDVSTSPPQRPAAPIVSNNATPEQLTEHAAKLKAFTAEEANYDATIAARWAAWLPRFESYDVVISNYNGETWPDDVRDAFIAYVKNGGGFVSYHAANNAFPEWPEYNQIIGIGGWRGRDEKAGPYLRLRGDRWIRLARPGPGGGHGPRHEFPIEVRASDHPIMRGLPSRWMHATDELYHALRGPAENVTVLASAFSDRTNEHEPMLMALQYGKGRIFHTTLGHATEALQGLGFQVTFQRGTEWAATGRVSMPAPKPEEFAGPGSPIRNVSR